MSNFIEAADAIRTIAKRLEGFQLAANALESIGSIEQAANEAKAAAAKAIAERDKANAELYDLIDKLAAVRLEAKDESEKMKSNSAAALAQLELDCQAMRDTANKEIEVAKALYSTQLAASIKDAKDETAKEKAKAAKLKESNAELDAALAAKQSQLAELNALIDGVKAKFA